MRRNIKVLLFLCISWIFVVVYYLQTATVTKGENRALRLKEGITLPSQYEEVGLVPGGQLPLQGSAETTDGRLTWNYFDEEGYVSRAGLRQGEDPYIRNRFNQEASDNLPSNREIPDTRNPM